MHVVEGVLDIGHRVDLAHHLVELQAAVLRSPMGAHGLLTMPEVLADQLASVLRARRADVTPGVLEVAV